MATPVRWLRKPKQSLVTWLSPQVNRPHTPDWDNQGRQPNSLSPSRHNGPASTGVSYSTTSAVEAHTRSI